MVTSQPSSYAEYHLIDKTDAFLLTSQETHEFSSLSYFIRIVKEYFVTKRDLFNYRNIEELLERSRISSNVLTWTLVIGQSYQKGGK